MRRPFLRCLFLAVVMLAGACKGPVAPLDIGSKDVALDLLIGARTAVASAPLPPIVLELGPTGVPTFRRVTVEEFADPPALPARTTTTLGPGECPPANPLASPKLVANNTFFLPPAEATYSYRVSGRTHIGGANVTEVPLPPVATVAVKNPIFDLTTVQSTWQVAVTLDESTTTTSYRVAPLLKTSDDEPQSPASPADVYTTAEETGEGGHRLAGGSPQTIPRTGVDVPGYPREGEQAIDDNAKPYKGVPAGLYVTKVESSGDIAPFQPPAPGILLAKLPLAVGDAYDVAASDGTTTMSYRSTIGQKATVDACGTPLDSWTVTLSKGRIVTANGGQRVSFDARYQLGTQYGGLILEDDTQVDSTPAVTPPIARSIQTTATREPKA